VGFLDSLQCLCIKPVNANVTGSGNFTQPKINCVPAVLKTNIVASSTITAPIVRLKEGSADISFSANISAKLNLELCLRSTVSSEPTILENLTANYNLREKLITDSNGVVTYADKFAGIFENFECLQKLYPIADISSNGSGIFVGPANQTENLYSFIDEGVFTGDYNKNFNNNSVLLSDDKETYITPSSIHT
jgi:hypothetical protein